MAARGKKIHFEIHKISQGGYKSLYGWLGKKKYQAPARANSLKRRNKILVQHKVE